MSDAKNVMESMYKKLDEFLKTETVIGEPIDLGEVKLVPIITASFGLGGGMGEEGKSNASGGGGGVGCRISPDAILVVKGDNVEMLPVKSKSMQKLFEQVPEIISKISGNKEKNEQEEKKEDSEE